MDPHSFTITHLAYNPHTNQYIYALRIAGLLPARSNPDNLHITASEELLRKAPDLVEHYESTDEEVEVRLPTSSSTRSRKRKRSPRNECSGGGSRKLVWVSGTDTEIRIGDMVKANDGEHRWEGMIRSLADARHGCLTATTRNCTVRAFAPGDVLIKREAWLEDGA